MERKTINHGSHGHGWYWCFTGNLVLYYELKASSNQKIYSWPQKGPLGRRHICIRLSDPVSNWSLQTAFVHSWQLLQPKCRLCGTDKTFVQCPSNCTVVLLHTLHDETRWLDELATCDHMKLSRVKRKFTAWKVLSEKSMLSFVSLVIRTTHITFLNLTCWKGTWRDGERRDVLFSNPLCFWNAFTRETFTDTKYRTGHRTGHRTKTKCFLDHPVDNFVSHMFKMVWGISRADYHGILSK